MVDNIVVRADLVGKEWKFNRPTQLDGQAHAMNVIAIIVITKSEMLWLWLMKKKNNNYELILNERFVMN